MPSTPAVTSAASTDARSNPPSPTNLSVPGVPEVIGALRLLVADVFALYLKTKNFHWHVSGPHFRDYHLLFDEQADQLLPVADAAAERRIWFLRSSRR